MMFQIIPTAEASVMTLMESINRVIINPLIVLLFALAVVFFIYGLVKYLLNPDNEEIRKSSKSHMLWGIIGMFIMVSVFGIMSLILNTIGEDRIQIQSTGDYTIGEMQ
jgi:predicted PurR-regulated permease PerM